MNNLKKPDVSSIADANNPLAGSDFKIPVHKRTDSKVFINQDGLNLPNEYEVEAEPITKIYKKHDNRKFVARLTTPAKSLYLHLLYEVEYGKDYLWINVSQYMEENLISSINTYKTAVAELVRYNVICPTLVKGVYWINPRLFFCGSRVKKYPKHVVVPESEQPVGRLKKKAPVMGAVLSVA